MMLDNETELSFQPPAASISPTFDMEGFEGIRGDDRSSTTILDGMISDVTTDDIDGIIGGLGFFQDGEGNDDLPLNQDFDDAFRVPEDVKSKKEYSSLKWNPPILTSGPFLTNDTGAVAEIPEYTAPSNEGIIKIQLQNGSSKDDSEINVVQPKTDVITCSDHQVPSNVVSIETVLEEQRKIILRNQEIIEAQRNKLKDQQSQSIVAAPSSNSKTNKGLCALTKLKADDVANSTFFPSEKGSVERRSSITYKRWKSSSSCDDKLRVLEYKASELKQKSHPKQEVISSNKNLTGVELELRRERNRKHAQKSRLRKKSLTCTLEQSLEALRDENRKLRGFLEAKKATAIRDLLDQQKARSHDRFIECILSSTITQDMKPKGRKGKRSTIKYKAGTTRTRKKILPSGNGIYIDESFLKTLKGFATALSSSERAKKMNEKDTA